MTIEEFIGKIEEEIEELEPGALQPETNYRDLEDWSSMHALIIIALVDTEYDVTVTGDELRNCNTVQELYDHVVSKLG